ncbi:hypothetical protein Tco_1524808 [Tanacetum coccineum]
MDMLSMVSKYLNGLEEYLEDGDSVYAKEFKLAVFTKAPLRAFGEPFMRYSLPCKVDGQGAWDAELLEPTNPLDENGGNYRIRIGMSFAFDEAASRPTNPLDENGGSYRIRIGMSFAFDETELNLADLSNYVTEEVLDKMGFVRVSISDYGRKVVDEVRVEIPGITFLADFVMLDYANEGEPSIMFGRDFLATTRSKFDFGLGRERLRKNDFSEEDKLGIIDHGLPKNMCDPGNYVLSVRVNGVIEMMALVDTGASVSVIPYSLYKDLGLGDPRPYQSNLTMADNTQAKAMGEVKNIRIRYQAYVVDFLVLDILVDQELPLLFGRPFLRTCGAIIDMVRRTLYIDDGVFSHTYFPKPRAKSYTENFDMEGEDDWLECFKVGRDEDGNAKYGLVSPSFLDIEDDTERSLAMEAYFNPFKNIIVFKKLVDSLGSLLIQLKNADWGNEGYGMYRKIDGDGVWHARFEIVTPSRRKFKGHSRPKIQKGSSWANSLPRTS